MAFIRWLLVKGILAFFITWGLASYVANNGNVWPLIQLDKIPHILVPIMVVFALFVAKVLPIPKFRNAEKSNRPANIAESMRRKAELSAEKIARDMANDVVERIKYQSNQGRKAIRRWWWKGAVTEQEVRRCREILLGWGFQTNEIGEGDDSGLPCFYIDITW